MGQKRIRLVAKSVAQVLVYATNFYLRSTMRNKRNTDNLDQTDIALLNRLQADARITNVALAESATCRHACLRRVRDLETSG